MIEGKNVRRSWEPSDDYANQAFADKVLHWLQVSIKNNPADSLIVLKRFENAKRGERIPIGSHTVKLSELYLDKYTLFRTLSECCIAAGKYRLSAQYALIAGRFDLVGDSLFLINDFLGAAKAYVRHGVSQFGSRQKKLLYCAKHLASEQNIIAESHFKSRFSVLYKDLISHLELGRLFLLL